MSSLIFCLQAKKLRLSVCFNTFRNFNKRRDVSCTNNNNWLNDKEMRRQTSSKQRKAQTQGMQPNKQMVESAEDARCPRSKSSLSSNGSKPKQGNID